jgi:hypothetical protein
VLVNAGLRWPPKPKGQPNEADPSADGRHAKSMKEIADQTTAPKKPQSFIAAASALPRGNCFAGYPLPPGQWLPLAVWGRYAQDLPFFLHHACELAGGEANEAC